MLFQPPIPEVQTRRCSANAVADGNCWCRTALYRVVSSACSRSWIAGRAYQRRHHLAVAVATPALRTRAAELDNHNTNSPCTCGTALRRRHNNRSAHVDVRLARIWIRHSAAASAGLRCGSFPQPTSRSGVACGIIFSTQSDSEAQVTELWSAGRRVTSVFSYE